MTTDQPAKIIRVAGPVVVAEHLSGVSMYEVVHVGRMRLVGEVIRLGGNLATIQVYEDTGGLRVGEPVFASGHPFQVELGPGLLGSIFDGVQRPLPVLRALQGDFVTRGGVAPALDRERRWQFTPCLNVGDSVMGGDALGIVQETPTLQHRILTPPEVSGEVQAIEAGEFTVTDIVAVICDETRSGTRHWELSLMQRWPARQPRPHWGKLDPTEPLVTGQRVLDTFFPLPKGGAAIIPGGFGTGKTVLEQTLSKWADADVIV